MASNFFHKPKFILHLDGDSFFAAVEIAKNPKLRGLPVVVGRERGIVVAASYEAKALGVPRGMPIFQLKKKYPQVILLDGDYDSYVQFNAKMVEIVRRYVDDVEEYSIDECFGDLTGLDKPLKMTYAQIAEKIKNEIQTELDITVSMGVAPTKVLAKVASKWRKPNGFTVIEQHQIKEFLKDVPIGKVWGIGRATSLYLIKRGIKTAGELANMPREWVMENLAKPGKIIWNELNGTSVLDVDPKPRELYKSIQKTRTFHPSTNDKVFLFSQLSKHIEDACAKARYYNLIPTGASIFIKTRGFEYITHSLSLPFPTNAPEVLISLARRELDRMHKPGTLYRTAGVGLHGLTPVERLSHDLFGQVKRATKFEEVHKVIDRLERKYGRRVVHLASTHQALEHNEGGSDADDPAVNLLFL